MSDKEAHARIKIDQLLIESDWRFQDNESGDANILLEQNVKTRGGEQSQKSLDESRSIVSYSSAGRTATDKRR